MKNDEFLSLVTEQQNPDTTEIDSLSTEEILKKINEQDQTVPLAIKKQIPEISNLVEASYNALKRGGRILYIGAGTSGRLGILDASECPPTYGVSPDLVQGIIAGGEKAIFMAQEGAEDSQIQPIEDLKKRRLNKADIVIGLAASGRTPYVVKALEYANSVEAATGSICCVKNGRISQVSKYPIEVITGPEVITGSTRMKAGTAQKLILNMISTSVMIKMGKVYHNYMVDLQPTNEKLQVRACHMIKTILDIDDLQAFDLYVKSGKNVKTALVMALLDISQKEALTKLDEADGHISRAIEVKKELL